MNQFDNSFNDAIVDMLRKSGAMDYLEEIEEKLKVVNNEFGLEDGELEVQDILEDNESKDLNLEKEKRELQKFKEEIDKMSSEFAIKLKAHLRKRVSDIDANGFNAIIDSIKHSIYGITSDSDFAHIFAKSQDSSDQKKN